MGVGQPFEMPSIREHHIGIPPCSRSTLSLGALVSVMYFHPRSKSWQRRPLKFLHLPQFFNVILNACYGYLGSLYTSYNKGCGVEDMGLNK